MIKNPQPTKHLEVKTYAHKGVSVMVKIDYDKGTISLMEKNHNMGSQDVPKKWVFAERGIEYMAGWLNILEAMSLAIGKAESELLAHQKAKEKALQEKEKDLYKAMADMKPEDGVLKKGYKGNFDLVPYKGKKK